jgi:hypothetical protein
MKQFTKIIKRGGTLMRYMALGLIIALIVAISGISVLAAETKAPVTIEKVKTTKSSAKSKTATKVTLGDSFKKAHDSFVKKDTKSAVSDIRKSAEFIKSISERTVNASRETLTKSAQELEKLADGIEKGTVTSAKELDDSFASASKSLAKYYSMKANESIKDEKKAGKDLKAAADYLEASYKWAGTKADNSGIVAIKNARETAKKMEKGGKLGEGEVIKSINGISTEIDKNANVTKVVTTTNSKEIVKPVKTIPLKKPVTTK